MSLTLTFLGKTLSNWNLHQKRALVERHMMLFSCLQAAELWCSNDACHA